MAQTFKSLINIYQPSLNGLDIQTLNLTNIYISAQCQWLRHSILNHYLYKTRVNGSGIPSLIQI